MKICLIGPGMMPIPPVGWGGVEHLIHNYYIELSKRGHEVEIINTKDLNEIIQKANVGNFDAVNLHYDAYASIMPHINCSKKLATSHYPWLENPEPQYTWIYEDFANCGCHVVALSDNIKDTFVERGCDESNVSVLPNGIDPELYHFEEDDPKLYDKSIFLAKIEPRKRQHLIQGKGLGVHFAGVIGIPDFPDSDPDYLGELTKDQIHKNLTDYANMVLLSEAEAHAFVCTEALVAGLGLVITEGCTAHLDTDKPFISVIPEDRLSNDYFVKTTIEENRQTSLSMRPEIRAYGKENFGWDTVMKRYEEILT